MIVTFISAFLFGLKTGNFVTRIDLNYYNEAYVEAVLVAIFIPCILYAYVKGIKSIKEEV